MKTNNIVETPIDLRVQFKMTTGFNPLWELNNIKPKWQKHYSYTLGKLKSIYGLWIEEKLGNYKKLRNYFYKRTCINPTFNNEYLKQDYILYLEEIYIKNNLK
jgi:hypothetical protein